jgi:hypothetical protein
MSTLAATRPEVKPLSDVLWDEAYPECERKGIPKTGPSIVVFKGQPPSQTPLVPEEIDSYELVDFPMPRGLPRPLWRGMPIPYTVAVIDVDEGGCKPNLRQAGPHRSKECRRDDLCIHCGDALEVDCVVVWDSRGGVVDGGLHLRCARMVRAHCPRVRQLFEEGRCSHLTGPTKALRQWTLERFGDPDGPPPAAREPYPFTQPRGFLPL